MTLQELFDRPRHVWVLEYGITHAAIRLAVHDGDYPKYSEVICTGCSFICGQLQGGPYDLAVEQSSNGVVRIVGDGFELRCSEARVARART
jgi:hypothetical protein